MRLLLILIGTTIFFLTESKAQSWELLEKNEPFYYRYRCIDSLNAGPIAFPSVPYSSYMLRANSLGSISKKAGTQMEALKRDPHAPEHLFLEQSIQYFKLDEGNAVAFVNTSGVSYELFIFYAPPLNSLAENKTFAASGCLEPAAIPQSYWRNGLPDPGVVPGLTPTHHVIVHHSAGSNTNSDPTALVRDIYLLHTQGNGWDDIGYNYLVARNGSIFLGRDPQGAGDQDFVRGAHYCAKNSYTQGICLLGEYSQSTPPDTMMQSLRHLCAWKMFKDRIEPENQSLHPPGDPNAILVFHLDGHRSGCATDCPGDQVYAQLHDLRITLTNDLLKCGFTSVPGNLYSDEFQLYYSETQLLVHKSSPGNCAFHFIDLSGRLVYSGELSEGWNKLNPTQEQLLILCMEGQQGVYRQLVGR